MGGIAAPIQQVVGQVPQQPGQVPVQGGFGQQPAKGGTLPPFALPSHYQSPYANYGFDPGLQSYLDQQNYRSANDAGVAFQYDPTNQTFTGGTMGGTYNPIPLSVMQQAAGGNNSVLSPYFQSKYPQPTGPVPTVKPGMDINQIKEMFRGQPRPMQPQGPQQPFIPRPYPGQGNDMAVVTRPYDPNAGIEPVQARPRPPVIQPGPGVFPRPQQRGLGALQTDKFRRRLG